MKEMGKTGPAVAVDRMTRQWLPGLLCQTQVLCRVRSLSHCRPPLPEDGSKTATFPVADSHQARVNDGRTEEQGPVPIVEKIKTRTLHITSSASDRQLCWLTMRTACLVISDTWYLNVSYS